MLMNRYHHVTQSAFIILSLVASVVFLTNKLSASSSGSCAYVDVSDWDARKQQWMGREIIGFASWCSSCKDKLLATKAEPSKYIFMSVFEDPGQSAEALARLGLASSCIYGDKLARKLGIKSLPWSSKL